jgi:hypothetical protein
VVAVTAINLIMKVIMESIIENITIVHQEVIRKRRPDIDDNYHQYISCYSFTVYEEY